MQFGFKNIFHSRNLSRRTGRKRRDYQILLSKNKVCRINYIWDSSLKERTGKGTAALSVLVLLFTQIENGDPTISFGTWGGSSVSSCYA